ncbi:MAG: lipid-A-disaccharide synthase [Planctomycetota bacterium]
MRIFFSAGEPSGDQHTARLIHELRKLDPQFHPEGFGGPAMRSAGCSLLFELTDLAVMGFLRVVPLLAKFRRLVRQAESYFESNPPDAVVLVDFPGFNWWIARAAKKRKIPVFYYLPPQLWGWAGWRIRRVRRWVDHVICTLPFEHSWYSSRGVRTTWVGHPFFDQVAERRLDDVALSSLRDQTTQTVVAVLPGSRNHEIDKNWPVMLEVMRRVSEQAPHIRWNVGSYKTAQMDRCRELQSAGFSGLDLHYIVDRTSEVIATADCCFMVSGSISLELLGRRKPGIVLYRVPTIGRFFARFLMTCRFITLPNLMVDDELMPEFISNGDPEADIRKMTSTLLEWVTNDHVLKTRTQLMSDLADTATQSGASSRAAELIVSEVNQNLMPATRRAA